MTLVQSKALRLLQFVQYCIIMHVYRSCEHAHMRSSDVSKGLRCLLFVFVFVDSQRVPPYTCGLKELRSC